MPYVLDAEFGSVGDDLGLFVTAEVSRGWGHHGQTNCFLEQTSLDYHDDRSLRLGVRVDAKPRATMTIEQVLEALRRQGSIPKKLVVPPRVQAFPEEVSDSGEAMHFAYGLASGRLVLVTTMGIVTASRFPDGRKTGFYEQRFVGWQGAFNYRLRFSVALKPSQDHRSGDIREYDLLPFAPGGLPELGKRR